MRRSLPAVLLALLLLAPASATAKTTSFTGTAKARAIDGSVIAGYTTGSLGKGGVVYTTKAGPNNTIVAKFVLFEPRGTLTGTSTVTTTQAGPGQPGDLKGDATITGGTGVFRGATGSFTVDGTVATDGLITIKSVGKFTTKG